MRIRVFPLLLLAFLPASVAWAQEAPRCVPEATKEPPRTVPEARQDDSGGQYALVGVQTPRAQNQKLEDQHPRLFWVLPTYTVVLSKSPTPLTARGKWRLFVKDETDPFTIGSEIFEAGIAQANNDFAGYGRGGAGYGKRFGAGFADDTAGGFFGTFLFPSILHQDPRYYRLGGGPFKRRLGHALIRPVFTHTDSGGRAFNWSGILGSIATSSLSNAYYPEGNRGAGATFSRVAMSIPFSMLDQLINEFGPDLQKKVTGKKKAPRDDPEN
jgi:hypothetical protein